MLPKTPMKSTISAIIRGRNEVPPAALRTLRGLTPEVSLMPSQDTPTPTEETTEKGPNPSGLCMCGCGRRTTVPKWNCSTRGVVKGQPRRYCKGHRPATPTIPYFDDQRQSFVVPLVSDKYPGLVAIIDPEDVELVGKYRWFAYRSGRTFYASAHGRTNNGKRPTIIMHRLITGASSKTLVDHADGNGLNNSRSNLRFPTSAENAQNRPQRSDAIHSSYKGVIKMGKKWHARICAEGVTRYLGLFETAEDAARVYDDAARDLHGEYATLNFPRLGERSALKEVA